MIELDDRLTIERRISKTEESLTGLRADMCDIKRSLHWLTGLVFSINLTILGVVIKGFGIIG